MCGPIKQRGSGVKKTGENQISDNTDGRVGRKRGAANTVGWADYRVTITFS